jgi:histidinol-phosphate aminotransferase
MTERRVPGSLLKEGHDGLEEKKAFLGMSFSYEGVPIDVTGLFLAGLESKEYSILLVDEFLRFNKVSEKYISPALNRMKRTLEALKNLYEFEPEIMLSSEFMKSNGYKKVLEETKEQVKECELADKLLQTVPEKYRASKDALRYPLNEIACVEFLRRTKGVEVKLGPPQEKKYDEVMQDLGLDIDFAYVLPAYALGTKEPEQVVHYVPNHKGKTNGQRLFLDEPLHKAMSKLLLGPEEASRYLLNLASFSGYRLGKDYLTEEEIDSLYGKKLKKIAKRFVLETYLNHTRRLFRMNIKNISELSYPEYADEKKRYAKIDLSISENCLVSKKVLNLLRKQTNINEYQLTQDPTLLRKLSEKLGINQRNILITAGCDSSLHHISETFINKGDKILIPSPSFGIYEFHTKIMGGEPVFVNFSEFPFEFNTAEIMRAAGKVKPRLLFLANPNNPTGHYIGKYRIVDLLENSKEMMIVVDEALIDYLDPCVSCIDLVTKYKNLIVTRSFSKLYGLAGMRIGYLASNKNVIKHISKTISPFEVCSLAIESAVAVLNDYNHLNKSKELVKKNLKRIKELRLKSTNSSCSVIVIESDSKQDIHLFLLKNGIKTVSSAYFRGLEKRNAARINLASSTQHIQKLCLVLKKFKN